MRLATCRNAFAGIPQKDLGAIMLYSRESNVTPINTERRRLFRDKRRR